MQNQISTSRIDYQKIKKWAIIISIILGVFLIFFAIYEISKSYIVTFTLFIIIFIIIGRIFGRALMFPASFRYYKGNVQIMYANRLLSKMDRSLLVFQSTCNTILNKENLTNNQQLTSAQQTLTYFLELYMKLERDNIISPKKLQFYNKLKQLNQYYKQPVEQKSTLKLKQFFNNQLQNMNQYQINLLDIQIFKMRETISNLKQILKSFKDPIGFFKSIYFQMYGEKFYEIKFAMYEYDQKYKYKYFHLKTKDNNYLDCILIQSFLDAKNENESKNKETVIFCNPNGCIIQTLPFELGYIDFYLRKNYNVCLWNYRGCGYSTGTPSLSTNEKDAVQIYDFLIKIDQKPTIAHGYSIGGPTAVYLGSKRSLHTLIADRTLYCLDELAIDFGKILTNLMKILFFRDRKDYSKLFYNFLGSKMIIYDPYDEIISNRASMKSGIAYNLIKDIKESEKDLINDQSSTHALISKFYTLFKKQKQTSGINYLQFLTEQFVKSFALNTSKFILQKKSIHHLSQNLPNFEEAEKIINQQCTQQFLDQKINEQLFEKPIDIINQEVNDILECLDGAGVSHIIMSPQYASSLTEQNLIKQIQMYLYGMITFGSYVQLNYLKVDHKHARMYAIIKLATIIRLLKSVQLKYEEQEINIKILTKTRQQFSKIALFMKQNLKNQAYRKVGTLLPIRCGHNGNLRQDDYSFLNKFLDQNNDSNYQLSESQN